MVNGALAVGDTIEGRYRVLGPLGEGGMGTVYLVEHVLIQRRLALKMLHERLAADASVVERFMNEARAAGTLGHPNIVESTDMGFTRDGIPYIVFEYLEGSLLTDEIYRLRGLPVRRALRIAYQIASALDAAHNAGIVHRDLKSDNIFLTDREDISDHVKVLDFGVSRFQTIDGDRAGPSQVMGTPEYMAPEQITAPAEVDARADVYGLGVILYEMLCARCPFRADHDPHAVLHQVVHDPVPPLDVPGLPVGLSEMIISKLLAKDPAQRYASMKDVAGAIEAFHLIIRPSNSRTPLSIPRMEPPDEGPAPAKVVELPAPQPRRGGFALLAAAIAAGAAGTVLMVLGDRQETIQNTTALPGLEVEAQKLGAAFENAARSSVGRAEGVASTPMVRAAIETDAATLKDMAGEDFLFKPKPGEVLEIQQLAGNGEHVTLLRLPDKSTPIAVRKDRAAWFETAGDQLRVIVTVPVQRQAGTVGGAIALAAPFDLERVKEGVAKHTTAARLVGFDAPIALVGTTSGNTTSIPVPLAGDLATERKLAIEASLPPPTVTARRFARERVIAWALGGFLFAGFLVNLLRQRSKS